MADVRTNVPAWQSASAGSTQLRTRVAAAVVGSASVSCIGERAQAEVCCWCQHKRLELSRALARATRACTSRIARTMSERQLRVGPAARQQAKMRQQQTRLAHPHRAIPQMTGKAQSSSVGGCELVMAPGTFATDLSARVPLHAVGGATIQPF